MLISIDPGSSQPLFEQLAASIRAAIVSGAITAGFRLPAARELADSLDINIHTVLRSYQALRDEGFIELRRGRGAVVSDQTVDYRELSEHIDSLVHEAQRLGLTPGALSDLIRKAWT
ncbi:GntR family transcriptional regulator [Microbacteriaceae bacterium SG_E_30_P1]|uniref:GntR family transcriptional regulator n=1 Tax=Antiquaquibacter oligotrophicus TaxID=2880260 RepID=A0ABT6KMK0_9MICO|nr:GntR family transcriptional regulator [Antiquaquibacter oligotrophicus]MDH6181230.1 GntR family transcriptional regulator [Antiquaquibacter oligotrophicus]UDF13075.1 GntR family transcriptional regulator [Antiquaquibacter oligotrophicus]